MPAISESTRTMRARRIFRPTLDRFVVGLLVTICVLWLAERFAWFGLENHRGWPVLWATTIVGAAVVVLIVWCLASLLIRRRFQLRLRTALGLMLVIAIVFAWLGSELAAARRQANIVAWWQQTIKGEIDYGLPEYVAIYRRTSGATLVQYVTQNRAALAAPTWVAPDPPAPAWLVKIFGYDFFVPVRHVSLKSAPDVYLGNFEIGSDHVAKQIEKPESSVPIEIAMTDLDQLPDLERAEVNSERVTDAKLALYRHHPRLMEFNLSKSRITGRGFESGGEFPMLRSLNVESTLFNDRACEQLAKMPQLKDLNLSNTLLSDAGLVAIGRIKTLEKLALATTDVTDAGLENLSGLAHLQSLDLRRCKISGSGLKALRSLGELRELDLSLTDISDAQLQDLIDLRQLTDLVLEYTAIGDDAVGQLSQMTNLKVLDLGQSRLSEAGAKRLQKSLPNCDVSR